MGKTDTGYCHRDTGVGLNDSHEERDTGVLLKDSQGEREILELVCRSSKKR